jgi:exodeoxyribonuclease V gamma subunit
MLNLLFSNRFEVLADRLVARIGEHATSVFDTDTVIVPSTAVRRALTLRIADAQGICAGVDWQYLAQWLWRELGPRVGGGRATMPFAAEKLAWRIHAALADARWAAPHRRLAVWLDAADERMRFDLAASLAGQFEQILVDRPEWAEAWSAGRALLPGDGDSPHPDAAWQAALWQRLVDEVGAPPTQAALRAAVEASTAADWPKLVQVFALPAIAPVHLQLLQAIARRTEVAVYALNPCREYWFDLVAPGQLAAFTANQRADHHETGHALLASWGGQAQVHLAALAEAAGDHDEAYAESGRTTLLAQLQDGLLNLQPPEAGALTLAAGDRSLEVHVCHSLVRELEVLHDRLLDLFGRDATLQPSDILVVLPDLDGAAPLVDAVFGTVPADRHVPYAITGRARSGVSPPARALLALLALVDGRAPVSEVAALLALPPVARCFGFSDAGLARLREWLREAGVHWALDAEHRAALGLPADTRHSLAEGVERLADAGVDSPEFAALQRVTALLQALRRATAQPLPAADWPALLGAAVDDFLQVDRDGLEDLAELRGAVQSLANAWAGADFGLPLPLNLVRDALAERLDTPARGGVPTGAVTFSAMTSLRTLPYRVVCVLGLSGDAFPGRGRPDEWDLVAAHPRRSDRQRRRDDRNLFLDLIIAAREVLHLSGTGFGVRDNRPLPLSVLVDELLEFLLPALAADPADPARRRAARERIVVEHPLQPFAERRFVAEADARIAGFDADYAQAHRDRLEAALRSRPAGRAEAVDVDGNDDIDDDESDRPESPGGPPFLAARLPRLPAAPVLQAERIASFLRHPSRFLLKERLGIALPRAEDELDDDEVFIADHAAQARLAERLLPALRRGAADAELLVLAQGLPGWPAGAMGAAELAAELPWLRAHARQLDTLAPGDALDVLAVQVRLPDGTVVEAALDALHAAGQVLPRYGRLFAGDIAAGWLRHLLLCASAPEGVDARTWLVGRAQCIAFGPVDAAPQRLAELVAAMHEGSAAAPRLFPRAALAYVRAGGDAAGDKARGKALGEWIRHGSGGEADDAWVRQALRGRPDPLADDFDAFAQSATAVFGPLWAHAEEQDIA